MRGRYLTPHLDCRANASDVAEWATRMFGAPLGAAVATAYAPSELRQPLPKCNIWDPPWNSTGVPSERAYADAGAYYMGAMRAAGDKAIFCRARQLSLALAAAGHQAYEYYFGHTPTASLNYPLLPTLGAFHGSEVPFVFGDRFELSNDDERILSANMGCRWRNFVHTGNPNNGPGGGCGGDGWPAVGRTPGESQTLVFTTQAITLEATLKQEQCDILLAASPPPPPPSAWPLSPPFSFPVVAALAAVPAVACALCLAWVRCRRKRHAEASGGDAPLSSGSSRRKSLLRLAKTSSRAKTQPQLLDLCGEPITISSEGGRGTSAQLSPGSDGSYVAPMAPPSPGGGVVVASPLMAQD